MLVVLLMQTLYLIQHVLSAEDEGLMQSLRVRVLLTPKLVAAGRVALYHCHSLTTSTVLYCLVLGDTGGVVVPSKVPSCVTGGSQQCCTRRGNPQQ